VSSQK
jgi:hypothetical protein